MQKREVERDGEGEKERERSPYLDGWYVPRGQDAHLLVPASRYWPLLHTDSVVVVVSVVVVSVVVVRVVVVEDMVVVVVVDGNFFGW